MNELIKKIIKLLDVKSITTICLIVALVVGFFKGMIGGDKLCEFVMIVLTFYFAKADKKEETKEYQGEE